LVFAGFISLFWVYKWWIVILSIIIFILIQIFIIGPIMVWIKVKIYNDYY
jgi:hypothetical protein